MTEWWHQPQRIVQTNLRLADASLDPEKVASDLAEFGATAMLFNVGGIFGWYPSRTAASGPQSPSRSRPRRRDDRRGPSPRHQVHRPLRPVQGHARRVRRAPRLVLRQQGRANRSSTTAPIRPASTATGIRCRRQSCSRRPLGRYEIDGLFFNMFGYLTTDYSFRHYGLCHCENCRREFREFSGGHELPAEIEQRQSCLPHLPPVPGRHDQGAQGPHLRRRESASGRPSASPTWGVKSDFFRGELNRRVDRPRPEWWHQGGEQARNYRSIGRNRIRHSSALTHFIDFPWRYSAETGAAQTLRLAQQLANGADPHYYVMGPARSAGRPQGDAGGRAVFAHHKAHEEIYTAPRFCGDTSGSTSQRPRAASIHAAAACRSRPFAARTARCSNRGSPLISSTRIEHRPPISSRAMPAIVASSSRAQAVSATARFEISTPMSRLAVRFSRSVRPPTTTRAGEARPASLRSLPVEIGTTLCFESRGGYLVLGDNRLPGIDSDMVLLDGPYETITPRPGTESLYRVLMPQRFGPPELCFTDEQPS